MGRFTPAWASALLAACVLLGLAFVAPAKQADTSRAALAAHTVAVTKPVHPRAAPARRVGSLALRAVPATHVARPGSCSAGLIALTFDDGPNPAVTRKLVRTLLRLKVPATFFMIGDHVDAHPGLARLVQRSGFTIGNHTWNHPVLTDLTAQQIRHQLHATRAAFRRHHIKVSHLMRPPYGAINSRVRKVVRDAGLIPVLWSIDSRDWAGGGPSTIAQRILGSLRRHRANLVLQHDGVDNSPASLAAVPIVVARARARGYCFTHLRWDGGVGGSEPPRTARRIGSGTSLRSATRTAVRAAPEPARTVVKVTLPRSAYLRALRAELPLRRH